MMIQGTMSSVGKSVLVAALCRIFKQDGLRVAPFKAQNMALNSYATLDNREVGRAQAMQAEAAGVDVTVEMNPVLIKPEADAIAQIVVMGKPWARLPAGEYMRRRCELWDIVTSAFDSLREQYEVVVIEGAGSPAELNLRSGDLVNMAMADYAGAPVLLVGNIDLGGVFAQLLGTHSLLDERERSRIRGFIVNKFRGDAGLFRNGVKILEERSGVRVVGVIPFIPGIRIADEDSVALDGPDKPLSDARLRISVIRFPHISNFDDFDPLRAQENVALDFVDRAEDLQESDLIILPGTKTTTHDLRFLRKQGLAKRIMELGRKGVPVLGICGGYQMLGQKILDPSRIESDDVEIDGLGLLPVITHFGEEKQTLRASARIDVNCGLFADMQGIEISGYEIHMGRTSIIGQTRCLPLLRVTMRGGSPSAELDGVTTESGLIGGTYFHGLFDNQALRRQMLTNLALRKGISLPSASAHFNREAMYERFAQIVRENMDMSFVSSLLKEQE